MTKYKITYKNGETKIVKADKIIDLVKRFNLADKENISTKITEIC